MAVTLVPLPRTPRAVARFLQVSYGIYAGDPHWVAPLLSDLKRVFTNANPLFEHAEMALWVARKDGRDAGRIAAVEDTVFNRAQNDRAAFFGFFESVDNAEVAATLFDAVRNWAKGRGLTRLLGPMNPTSNDECGLLVEGFDSRPAFMMPYNPRYYPRLVEGVGFQKTKDLLAFDIDVLTAPLERLARIAEKTRKRHPELKFTAITKRSLEQDLVKVKEVYNAAWEHNWGFTPMNDKEIDFMASRLKPLLVEGLVFVAETEREPVAFMLAIPDYNEPLQPLRGRLFTPRLFGFLPYLLQKKYPRHCRVVTLGVKESYRNKGLEAVMLTEGFKTGARVGFTRAEASWILEDNTMMCRLMEIFGGKVHKRYRLYDRLV